jgi:Uma2 family endonuclease
MVLELKLYTVEEFETFILQPENANRDFEYIGGRIVEVVSNNYSSEIGASLLTEVGHFVKSNHLGRVTGADGGYMVVGERYIPDVAYVSKDRQPKPSHEAYNPIRPDLAIEVLSPYNDPSEMRIKIVNYLRAGTTVWLVDPDKKRVEVYLPGQAPQTLELDGTLDGGSVLPGFKLAVSAIFPE